MNMRSGKTSRYVVAVLASLVLALCFTVFGETVKASAETKECKFGFTYSENVWNKEYYEIKLDKEMLVHIEIEPFNSMNIYNVQTSDEKIIIEQSDFFTVKSNITETNVIKVSRILKPGNYYIYLLGMFGTNGGTSGYIGGSLTVTTSDRVSLTNIKLTEVTSKKKGQLTIKVPKKDEDAEHIEVEYATDADFTDAVTVEVPEKGTVTIKNLVKGKKYFVRARQVAYYGDGGQQVSAWSVVKSKVVKK